MIVTFTVPGPPVPCARARVVAGHAHTPAKTRAYERHVHLCAMAAVSQVRGWRLDWGAYAVTLKVYRAVRRGDWDNYGKAAGDGMNGVVYADDAAIVRAAVELYEDPVRPRLEIVVEMIGDENAEDRQKRSRSERGKLMRAGAIVPKLARAKVAVNAGRRVPRKRRR